MKKGGDQKMGSEGQPQALQGVFESLGRGNAKTFQGVFKPIPGEPILCDLSEADFQFASENRTSVLRIEGAVTEANEDGSAKRMTVTQVDEIPWTRGRVK